MEDEDRTSSLEARKLPKRQPRQKASKRISKRQPVKELKRKKYLTASLLQKFSGKEKKPMQLDLVAYTRTQTRNEISGLLNQ